MKWNTGPQDDGEEHFYFAILKRNFEI